MAEVKDIIAKRGRDKILAFRIYEETPTTDGMKLALQIEHTLNYERNNEVNATKDGPVVAEGSLTPTLELKALASNDPVNVLLMTAFKEGKKLEAWEIDLGSPVDGATDKYEGLYFRGNLRSWSEPNPVEGPVEISTAMDIDGIPQPGQVTFTADMAAQAQYAFRDIPATATPVGA